MNILVTNDDGAESVGLQILLDALRLKWKNAHLFTIVPDQKRSGVSMAIRKLNNDQLMSQITETKPGFYTARLTPADIIYAAFNCQEMFLSPPATWDLVVSGVNYGANLGADVYHSGTVAAPMLASALYGVPGIAFSQLVAGQYEEGFDSNTEKDPDVAYSYAGKLTGQFLSEYPQDPGVCYGVNFPIGKPMDWKNVRVAPYSPSRPDPNLEEVKDRVAYYGRQSGILLDIDTARDGFVTVAQLELRVNPTVRV